MADDTNEEKLAAIEDDLRDPSKAVCIACNGTGENNAPPGFSVLITTCSECRGAGLINRAGTGPYVLVTHVAAHTALLRYEYLGNYRKRLVRGFESMDGKSIPPSRETAFGPSYKRSRLGLIKHCFQVKLPFAFREGPELVREGWAGQVQWIIGLPPDPPCAKFSLLRLDYGDWCRHCGNRAEFH